MTFNNDHAKAYIKSNIFSREKPNLIVMMTPILSVESELASICLEGLYSGECNVFAIDFPGFGNSGYGPDTITFTNMCSVLVALIQHIKEEYGDSIHMYGATGMGGILAQALCSTDGISEHIRSLSQFGVAIHSDLSILGDVPPFASKCLSTSAPLIHKLSKLMPNMRLPFKLQSYDGLYAVEERQWYTDMQARYPRAFDIPLPLFSMLLQLFTSSGSPLLQPPVCPTMVMASVSDRYYTTEYVTKYFNALKGIKKCHWFEDSHLAFYWNAKLLNTHVVDWVIENG